MRVCRYLWFRHLGTELLILAAEGHHRLEQVETLIASTGPWKIETYEAEKAFRFWNGMVETLDWPSIWRDRCSRGSRFSTAPFAASYLGEASHGSRFQAIYNGNS